MAASWRLARSLEELRSQINRLAPKRSKASDGTIGDAAHSSRTSDHNPWITVTEGGKKVGIVTALDITHDPKGGVNSQAIADSLVESQDPRIKYIISNGKIVSGTGGDKPAWKWRKYTGANAHAHHVHISVKSAKTHYDSDAAWSVSVTGKSSAAPAKPAKPSAPAAPAPRAPAPAPTPKPPKNEIRVDAAVVKRVQEQLVALGYTEVGGIDGVNGTLTKTAIRAFRAENDLPAGDHIDDELLLGLLKAEPREFAPERKDAKIERVVKKAPETAANWQSEVVSKYGFLGTIIVAIFTWVVDQFRAGREAIEPLFDTIRAVPIYAWVVLALLVLGYAWYHHRRGRVAGVEAFRTGARR